VNYLKYNYLIYFSDFSKYETEVKDTQTSISKTRLLRKEHGGVDRSM
jgi:hypothetical protein